MTDEEQVAELRRIQEAGRPPRRVHRDPFADALAILQDQAEPAPTPLRFFPRPTITVQRTIGPTHRRWDKVHPAIREVIRQVCSGESKWPLYLWSSATGTGKTSAALVMHDHCGLGWTTPPALDDAAADLLNGYLDILTLPGILRAVRGMKKQVFASNGTAITEPEIWNVLARRPLVIIDDIRRPAKQEQTLGDDAYTLFKRLLDIRTGRPLIVTGNLDPRATPSKRSELEQVWDDRIADRLVRGTVVEMAGVSRR